MPEDMKEDPRLAVRIPAAIDLRLRLQRSLSGRHMGQIVAELLDAALPTVEQLARQLHERGATSDR